MKKYSCRSDFISDGSSSDEDNFPPMGSLRERLARKQMQQESIKPSSVPDGPITDVSSHGLCGSQAMDKMHMRHSQNEEIKNSITDNYLYVAEHEQQDCAILSNNINPNYTEASRGISSGSESSCVPEKKLGDSQKALSFDEKISKETKKRTQEEIEENRRKAKVQNLLYKLNDMTVSVFF